MIGNKLIHFKTFAAFKQQLDGGNISPGSLVLIKDTKQIYTHGQLYGNDVESVTQTASSYQSGGTNTWTLTYTNGETLTLSIRNGEKGDKGDKGDQGIQGIQGPKGDTGTFDDSALDDYALKTYVDGAIADLVGAAPSTLDTLEEIADALENNATLSDIATAISTKANSADVYTKTEANQTFQPIGNYLTSHQDISGKANAADVYTKTQADERFQPVGNYLTQHQSLANYTTKTYVDGEIDTVESSISTLSTTVATKANIADVYTKTEVNALLDWYEGN